MTKNIIIKILLVLPIVLVFFIGNKVNSDSDFSKPTFTITVDDLTPMWRANVPWSTLEEKANNLLLDIIEILMVAIWVIALLVVSIWAGYMIFYNWKEEFLTKWRSMIFTWLLALFIALCSYYIMNLVRYILYN